MKVAAQDLQEQLDALLQLCPVLQPCVLPNGCGASHDLASLVTAQPASRKGAAAASAAPPAAERLAALHATAAAAGCSHCGLCGAADVLVASGTEAERAGEAALLRLTGLWRAAVLPERRLALERAEFACGACRELLDVPGVVAAMAAANADPGDEHATQRVRRMVRHMVAANHSSDHELLEDQAAALAWFQEAYARAYGLTVVCSHVRGWVLADVSGTPLPPPGASRAAAVADAAERLLQRQQQQRREKKGSSAVKAKKKASAAASKKQEGASPSKKAAGKRKQAAAAAAAPKQAKPATAGGVASLLKNNKKKLKTSRDE